MHLQRKTGHISGMALTMTMSYTSAARGAGGGDVDMKPDCTFLEERSG